MLMPILIKVLIPMLIPILIKVLIRMLVTNDKKRYRMTSMILFLGLVTFYIRFGTLSFTISGSICFNLSISKDL